MHHYKKLEVWNRAMDFSEKIYSVTKTFPDDEKFGLISQLRRSSISIPSNIAEGAGRGSNKDFGRFISIALGSAFENETQLLLACRLKFINVEGTDILLSELESISKMLNALKNKLV